MLALIAGVLTLLGVWPILELRNFWLNDVPKFGIWLGFGVAVAVFIAFLLGFRYGKRPVGMKKSIHITRSIIMSLSLAVAHAAIGFLAVVALAQYAGHSLSGLAITAFITAGVSALAILIAVYVTYIQAVNMSASRLAGVLALFMTSGALTSITTTTNHDWWRNHFSALGMGDTLSSHTFNLTMIIAGLIVISLSHYIIQELRTIRKYFPQLTTRKTDILRGMYLYIGGMMIGVGVFPYDKFRQLHDFCGHSLSAVFLAMIVLLPWLIPGFSAWFIGVSYLLVGVVAYAYWTFLHGPVSLLIVETIGMLIFFFWLTLFIRHMTALKVSAEQKS